MPRGNVNGDHNLKHVVIYLLRIWIIEGIPQISASYLLVVSLEVMCIRPNILNGSTMDCSTNKNHIAWLKKSTSRSWLCWVSNNLV